MEDRDDRDNNNNNGPLPQFSSLHPGLGHHSSSRSPPYSGHPPTSLSAISSVLAPPLHSAPVNPGPPSFPGPFSSPSQGSRSAPPAFSLPHPGSHHPPPPPPRRPEPSLLHSTLSNGSSAQKRAYRQRRKDPSCDACRERKVKCDATETSSCTECSTRNVKCQFTKETNRRMSSVKLITDMTNELERVKRLNHELQQRLQALEPSGVELKLPAINSMPAKRPQAKLPEDDPHIRDQFRIYAKGLFKPPPPYRIINPQAHFLTTLPAVPPRRIADAFLENYYVNLHAVIPIIHWPSFVSRYEEVYMNNGNLSNVSPSWASMLFAVFACGRVYSTDARLNAEVADMGKQYIVSSRMLTDLFNDEFTIDHARSALLTSIYLMEMNCKSASWTWLGSTVRIAQDVGLHRETGPWKNHEAEMRRRVWWGIYVWDRLLSIELGRVLLIDDADCDVNLPASLDDHFIYDTPDNRMPMPLPTQQPANFLLTTIHIMRTIGPMLKALQRPQLTPDTLRVLDIHLDNCLNTFPEHCRPGSNPHSPLKPQELSPICYLMNTKIVLHRHNLSTTNDMDTRMRALEDCVKASSDTVCLLRRAMQYIPQPHEHPIQSWRDAIARTANSMLCTHIWRCALFLSFRKYFAEALTCVEVLAAIGEMRSINTACGRYLNFFITQLGGFIERHEAYETNEMMLALVSGDLQGSSESSWIWAGSETGAALNRGTGMGGGNAQEAAQGSALAEDGGARDACALSEEEKRDWGGWGKVEGMLRVLASATAVGMQGVQQTQPQPPPPPPQQQPQLPHSQPETRDVHVPTTSASRISIANIIGGG